MTMSGYHDNNLGWISTDAKENRYGADAGRRFGAALREIRKRGVAAHLNLPKYKVPNEEQAVWRAILDDGKRLVLTDLHSEVYLSHTGDGSAQIALDVFRQFGFSAEWDGTEYRCVIVYPYKDETFDAKGRDNEGRDRDGFARIAVGEYGTREQDAEGYDREGRDVRGFRRDGSHHNGYGSLFNYDGFAKDGIHRETGTAYSPKGFDIDGFSPEGRNDRGWDRDGWDENHLYEGTSRFKRIDGDYRDFEGYDMDGENAEGHTREQVAMHADFGIDFELSRELIQNAYNQAAAQEGQAALIDERDIDAKLGGLVADGNWLVSAAIAFWESTKGSAASDRVSKFSRYVTDVERTDGHYAAFRPLRQVIEPMELLRAG
jgi:hypothetical protein